jgi:DNA-binding beta-propeller fold protein YncE
VPAKQLGWLLFDRFSQQAFVFGKESHNVVVIDGATDKITANIPLSGVPEFACPDDTAFVYATIRDKNEVVVIDIATHKVAKTYKLTEDKGPTGITIDVKNDRLMLVCTESNTMVVLSQSTGKKIASYPIGKKSEGIIYEKDLHLVITSNGEGSISIFKQLTADDYQLAQTIKTAPGHKYMCHRGTTHKFYLSGAAADSNKTSENFAVEIYNPVIQ